MYVESCTILVVVNRLSRPIVVLDGLLGLYGFKYDSATACGMPLYLYSYKLVGSVTLGVFYFWFCRVSLAEYLLVLRVLFPIVVDGTVYHGYCKSCFYPAMDEE